MAYKHGLDIPECPEGNIFGGDEVRVQLIAPNGRVQSEFHVESDNAKAWGESEKDRLLSQPLGDGGKLSDYSEMVKSIYGLGPWEIRVFDGTYKSGY